MNARLAGIFLVVLAVAGIGYLVTRPGDAPPPAPPPEPRGALVETASPRSSTAEVRAASMPSGRFVMSKLGADLESVEASYDSAVATLRGALPALGVQAAGEPLVLAHGQWGAGGWAELILPVTGAPDAAALSAAGLSEVQFEGGDAFAVEMNGAPLRKALSKADAVLRDAAEADRSRIDGMRVYEILPSPKGRSVRVRLDLRDDEAR